MMTAFNKKHKKSAPVITTASLPDIVFMLLFFFMTVTTMVELDLKVQIIKPKATEVKKLENKSLIEYINIGPPIRNYQAKFGEEPIIQLNDAFAKIQDVGPWINAQRKLRDESNRSKMTAALRIHSHTHMGIVTDVKQELRKADALKITYLADKEMHTE